jgi:hypothetical protein
VNRHAKASSVNVAGGRATTRARRTGFGMACLCVLGLAAFLGSGAPSAGAVSACPNEAIRNPQHATQLGQCRAWEMVSPLEKNGGEVFAEGFNVIASSDGNGVSYLSKTAFGDAAGTGTVGLSNYVARRGPGGWLTRSITPLGRPEALQVVYENTYTEVFSDDLSRVLVNAYDLPGPTDDVAKRKNLYIEDTATRALQTVTAFQRPGEETFPYAPFDFADPRTWGASADLRHVAFVSSAQFLPENPAIGYPNGFENVYTWDEGNLHLAGILPDGTVPPEGSKVIPYTPNLPEDYREAMSADGSRQIFSAAPASGAQRQLYLRIDNSRTAWISEPEGADQSEPQEVFLEGMTPDGHNVFFSTTSALVGADMAPGSDIYRWTDGPDPANEDNLTLITDNGAASPGSGLSVAGISDDGMTVYYHLSGDPLLVWSHGDTRYISAFPEAGAPKESLGPMASQPGGSRVSPDGRWLAYLVADLSLNHSQGLLYLYDLATDTLTCVSCSPAGDIAELVPRMTQGNRYDYLPARPRYLSDDGQVFFTTRAPLVPQDVNGAKDVYEFDGATGAHRLISTGRGQEAGEFVEASASGDDVFFVTRQRLTGWDTDAAADLYDARAGGGFAEPEPQPASCQGEACQGGLAATGAGPAVGSSKIRGAGNVKPGRRCGAKKRRVVRNDRARCVKKQRHGTRRAHRGGGGK